MFLKLFKYDFKRTRFYGLLILAVILVFGAALAADIALFSHAVGRDTGVATELLFIGAVLFMQFLLIALVVLFFAIPVLITVQFYKNIASDEGYLTFTLPVSVEKILLSKLLNAFIWTVLEMCALGICLGMSFGMLEMNTGIIWSILPKDLWVLLVVGLYIVEFIMSTMFQYLLNFTGIVIGSVVARKHKALSSLGFIVGIDALLNLVTGALYFGFMVMAMFGSETGWFLSEAGTLTVMLIFGLVLLLIYAAAAVGMWFLSRFLLKKKLNLA